MTVIGLSEGLIEKLVQNFAIWGSVNSHDLRSSVSETIVSFPLDEDRASWIRFA